MVTRVLLLAPTAGRQVPEDTARAVAHYLAVHVGELGAVVEVVTRDPRAGVVARYERTPQGWRGGAER